ncbi:MAG: AAA family ATPase [Fimbriimonadaceae bacterium]
MSTENTAYLPYWEIEKLEHKEWLDSLFTKLGDQPAQPQDFLIEGLLPRGYLAILAGEPKSGKSCLATGIALAVATGTPFVQMPTKQAPVLWLSLEESPAERAQHFLCLPGRTPASAAQIEHGGGTPSQHFEGCLVSASESHPSDKSEHLPEQLSIYTTHERLPIDTDEGLAALAIWIERTGAGLIVVDPLHAAHSGRSLRDGWAARRTLMKLKRFCGDRNIAALILHDLGAKGPIRKVAESSQLSSCASLLILMRTERDRGDPDIRYIDLECRGRGPFANRIVELESHGPLHYIPYTEPEEDDEVSEAQIKGIKSLIVAQVQKEEMTADRISKATGLNLYSVRNAITELLDKQEGIQIVGAFEGQRIYGPLRDKE